jgi:dihydrolipoamide dehydrogenase
MIDIAIIGGGPAGYVAAERASALGLSVILFEQRALGGVCLNEGCIPTKTLLYSAKIYENALHGAKYGVSAPGVSFDFAAIGARKNKVVRRLVAGVGAKMKAANVEVVKGHANITGRADEGSFSIACDGENGSTSHSAANLLICTGSEAFMLPVPGITPVEGASSAQGGESPNRIVTARELLDLRERPERLAIIGGGVIGMEFASFFNSLGTTVTVIEMLPEILGGFDSEIAAMLRDVYAKKGIEFHLGCRVTRVEGDTIYWIDPQGVESYVITDKILMSCGRRPVVTGFGLEDLGVELNRGGIKVDSAMRTNVPGVWAAGDVTGFSMLAHTASREGEVVVNNIAGHADTMRYDAVPGVVYTNPEVATVGLTLAQALDRGIAAREQKLPMAYAGRFVAENEGANGLCKVVVDSVDGRILGAHMIGGPSGEMIWGVSMAIERGLTVADFETVIFPHPTVSEILRETMLFS